MYNDEGEEDWGRLEFLTLSPEQAFICLVPPPPPEHVQTVEEEPSTDVSAMQSLGLLKPLSGSCLYVRALISRRFDHR